MSPDMPLLMRQKDEIIPGPDAVAFLKMRTDTRPDFIRFFGKLAGTVKRYVTASFPPLIVIESNNVSDGKSLAVDAIVTEWSDDHVPELSLAREDQKSFLENFPCDAKSTVSRRIKVDGVSLTALFNSDGDCYNLLLDTDDGSFKKIDGPVLVTNPSYHYRANADVVRRTFFYVGLVSPSPRKSWERTIHVAVGNPDLWKDQLFQEKWGRLTVTP